MIENKTYSKDRIPPDAAAFTTRLPNCLVDTVERHNP